MKDVICDKCGAKMIIRTSDYGAFLGCSNYPNCKNIAKANTFSEWLAESIYDYFENESDGINIYSWRRLCWKCKQSTTVYSYFLVFQILKNFPFLRGQFERDHVPKFWGGLGNLPDLDIALSTRYKTIQLKYSNTRKLTEYSNICEHCGSLQGNYFVSFNPQEIIDIFNYDDDSHEHFIVGHIKPSEVNWNKETFTTSIVKTLLYERDPLWSLYNL